MDEQLAIVKIQSNIRKYLKIKKFKWIRQDIYSICNMQLKIPKYSYYPENLNEKEFYYAILSKIIDKSHILIKDYRLNLNPLFSISNECNTRLLKNIVLIQSFIRGFIQRKRFHRIKEIREIMSNIQNIDEDSDDNGESLEELYRQYEEAREREMSQTEQQQIEQKIITSYKRRTINSSSGVIWNNSVNLTNNQRDDTVITEIRTNPTCNITANVIDTDGQVQAGRIDINNQVGDDTVISGGISASRDNAEASVGIQHNISENVNVTTTASSGGSSSVGVSASVSENITGSGSVTRRPGGSVHYEAGIKIRCTIM